MVNDRIWTLLTRKLSGEASTTELEELDQLLSDQPALQSNIQNISHWWDTNYEADQEFLEATYLQHVERMKAKGISLSANDDIKGSLPVTISSTKHLRTFRNLAIGIAAFGVGICSWMIFTSRKLPSAENKMVSIPAMVVAQHGARTKILLPDGSNVWLNSGSKLEYNKNFSRNIREVYLTGEAFFDVVRNSSSPFVIHTAKIDVRVLGTRFNVKAYENDATTETSLIRGSVEIFLKSKPSEKYLLKPNEKLVVQNNSVAMAIKDKEKLNFKETPVIEIKELTYLKGSQVDVETSWMNNILSFEDESFLDVSHKMERWYDVSFEFNNKKWQKQYLSGSFENETLEQAMTALKYSNGFDYIIEDNKVTIY